MFINEFLFQNINIEQDNHQSQNSSAEGSNISDNNSGGDQKIMNHCLNDPTTSSEKSPRKSRRVRKPEPPKLQPELKHELMNNDWEVSEFPNGDNANVFQSNPLTITDNIVTVDHATCTDPKDFAALQRLIAGEDPSHIPSNILSVISCRSRVISDSVSANSLNLEQGPIKVFKLVVDKSTNTEELGLLGNGVEFLKNCFPTIEAHDLGEVLEKCAGDVQWAVNVLLDAGYEYNEQPAPQLDHHAEKEIQDDVESKTMTNKTPSESPVDKTPVKPQTSPSSPLKTPPPLSLLSLQLIPSPEVLLRDDMQKNVAENSLHRLESIEEFHLQHQHVDSSLDKLAVDYAQSDEIYISDEDVKGDDVESQTAHLSLESEGASGGEVINEIVEDAPELKMSAAQPEEAQDDNLILTLTPQIAWQLEKMFGSPLSGEHAAGNSLM